MYRKLKILSTKYKHQTLMMWKRKSRDESDESEDTKRGEMNDDINRNINGVEDKHVIEIVVDQCLVFYQQIQIEGNSVDSLRSA